MIDRRQSPVTGRVVWRVRWYEVEPAGGRRERSRTFPAKREALDFERERAGARRAGVVASSRVPVAEVAERYFENLSGTVESRTIQGYRQLWRTHVGPAFGHVPVDEMTSPLIQRFVSGLSAQRSPATTRHAHRVLSLILDQAMAERRLAVNPARGVRLPSLTDQWGDHVLAVDQVEDLAASVRHHATLVRVAAYCGLRWGEVAALQVGDIDLKNRRISVERAQVEVSGRVEVKAPKSRHGRRRVPIPGRLVDELRIQAAGRSATALLFTSPEGERLRASNWKRWSGWTDAVRAMGGGIRFHDLRHTCASLLIQAGATPVEVQRILGHSTPATTLNLYTHLLPDALDGAAAKLDGYLDGRL
ncbi:tyrosine-type recombinase/integrase [Ornithinimicrobium murale]|uniref:tyrosine-type recombinase/integrase n=1 Tax=Ornithinimicrobium murale TaxID=1050153 RepID=UPI000E0DA71D|nr:site-specific integrase [Ornithinimicrobium murale]